MFGDFVTLYPVMLETMLYPIWTNAKISLGWLDGTKALSKRIPISWNQEETTIESAVLVVSAKNESVYGTTVMRLFLNGNKIIDYSFWFSGLYTDRLDVSAFLLNGPNQFDVDFTKNPVINPGAELTLTVTMELTYEGDQPLPPPPEWPEWWPLVPIGIVGFGVGLYLYTQR